MSPASPHLLPSLRDADWLRRPETRALFAALNRDGHTARAVGGAIRNTVFGRPVHDVDVATTATPDEVVRLAAQAGLKAVPTGIDHGTVTIIVDHTPFEVTTLRKDEETFGRHARVAFTDDFAADARRRDFTINALYCDADGTVTDPLDGYPDLVARRVRFIGDAADRIREDYLRIYRFLRFSAEYTDGHLDADGLHACRALRAGLEQISRERIRAELLRLLPAPHAVDVLAQTAQDFVAPVLPADPDVALLQRLVAIERALDRSPDALLRLSALSGNRPGYASRMRETLRLSSAEFERLAQLALPDPAFAEDADELLAKAYVYRHGPQMFVDAQLLAWARNASDASDVDLAARVDLPNRWQAPTLPVRGADIISLGIPPGPRVGKILAEFEAWWIDNGFPLDATQLAIRLSQLTSEAHPASHDKT